MRPRGRKAETDDGTDKRPVLLSTSTGRPSYFDHTNLETRPQMRRRPMSLSALLLLTHHGHGLNNRGRLVDEVQLDASLCPMGGRLMASHRAEVACGGGDGIASRTITVPKRCN